MNNATELTSADKITRKFIPKDLDVNNWQELEPFFQSLVNRKNETID